jgi:uncharacterized protein with LGFP repeats
MAEKLENELAQNTWMTQTYSECVFSIHVVYVIQKFKNKNKILPHKNSIF